MAGLHPSLPRSDPVFLVDGNTVIRDNYVNALSRSGYCGNFAADSRDPSLKQWSDYDSTLSSCCCIRMSALCTGDHTVRTYNYVTVKVYVYFQCCQDYEIQLFTTAPLLNGSAYSPAEIRKCFKFFTDSTAARSKS